tara:strand:- start:975 stop:1262 length:288 start_codon:yes stop_codon:yes gene_type:complete
MFPSAIAESETVAADRPVPNVDRESSEKANLLTVVCSVDITYPPPKYPAVPEAAIAAKWLVAADNPVPRVDRESSEKANLSTVVTLLAPSSPPPK